MRKSVRGFTIVELLIVVVVIAILAAITIVTYNGAQKRALNTARLTEVIAWKKQLLLYYANNGQGVDVTAGNYCLGYGFPSGKCRNYTTTGSNTYNEADNAALMTELKGATGGSLPSGSRQPVGNYIGPYVNIWSGQSGFSLYSFFSGGSSNCPAPLTYVWDDGAGDLMCGQDVSYN
ncbi:MAG TPA: prepilin-type N-terminal cleavage/methylation domain-containing protein [Candidatus Saccharimonadales bacterium]|nr:prepilin-type N-terminal cleavage/methylation domain-containing protein [Candidatus Saccharimonadales bacterium]